MVLALVLAAGAVAGLAAALVVAGRPPLDAARPGFVVAALVAGAAAVGLLLLMVRADVGVARADVVLAREAAEHATTGGTRALDALTHLGDGGTVTAAAAAVTLVEWRRDRRPDAALLVLVTVGGQFVVVHIVKELVERARPEVLQLSGFGGSAFPSGHATAAAATWACLALVLARGRRPRWRAGLAAAAVAIAVVVAGTRVALGVHWFTDVLAGLVLGWTWAAAWAVALGGAALPAPARRQPGSGEER